MRRIACTTCPASFSDLCSCSKPGLFGSFTALNFFHWFLFWELSLIPAFFLIKLWGGPRRGPAATQFFVYTMAGSVALLLCFLAIFLSTGSHGLWPVDRDGAERRAGAGGHGASRPGHAVARHRRACRLCGQSAADTLPHLAARGLRRGAFAGHHAAYRRHVEDGRLRPAAHRAADLRPANRRRCARRCWFSPWPPS